MEKARMLGMEQAAPGAARDNGQPMPDPAVPEKPVRRRFTAEYKLRILREADRCSRPGQLGALLRREGLYSSHLSAWRQQRDTGTLAGLAPKRRGRKPAPDTPLIAENERLKRENQRLTEKLRQAETVIEVQKNFPRCWRSPCHRPTAAGARHEGRRATCSPVGHGSGLPPSGRVPGDALSTPSAQAAPSGSHATTQAVTIAERPGTPAGPRRAAP